MAKIEDYTPPPISKDWTPEERLKAIANICQGISEYPTRFELWDALERIGFLAQRPAKFLQCNRSAILNGQE